ncbi:AcOrf-121 peptide [Autographa californica nucleopolyhedrovirus]|uniref:Transactivator protein ORF121 n=3 Tax=Alphabaculovirus aucalifornicae TaxID=3047383 RepID=AC121_NPVAC|nr:AcOrf-121 peptide [Autographa californica nucleopolyhedrovirus]P41674.1 RecName: Full=Transactivator protein ORF121 [Autographa californica nucleopolyhedrovirus]ABE68504.1 unknown [Plutella xylostella multiple nucleopolyhedrovirus]AKN58971.1 AcOrf-121 peptide [Autographa californica multiple nucleopolyhedrovirus]ARJ58790.1 Orf-121 protein [synthetic baculovirus AcMNPV-WIV-Syn1]UVY87234.1 Acorf121 protein [synthetic construct]AAA66751.1 AcOrf-121 peptide [Autographa californica nucleopolyhe
MMSSSQIIVCNKINIFVCKYNLLQINFTLNQSVFVFVVRSSNLVFQPLGMVKMRRSNC